ncbi:MAG: Gfo/Idh/MocA family oxidoreductase [Thermoplasmata archaeon]
MVGVGVIGIGAMGQNHARIYSELANLVGVADVDQQKAMATAKRTHTKSFSNYEELLSLPELDAVTIATPTVTHFEVAKKAMERGKHVLIEKPICNSVKEAENLIKLAEDAGVVLSVGHIERHNPVVIFTKDMLSKNQFGELISISSRRVSSFPARIRDVGVILDLGIHDIDVQRYMTGSEIESIYALAGRNGKNDLTKFEECANILLNFENGVSGFIEVNWLTPMKVRRTSLTCSEKFVELDYMTQSLQVSSSAPMDFEESNLFHIPQRYDIRRMSLSLQEPLKNEILDFLNSIKNKRKPLVTAMDGLRAIQAARAAVKSYKEKRIIDKEEFDA